MLRKRPHLTVAGSSQSLQIAGESPDQFFAYLFIFCTAALMGNPTVQLRLGIVLKRAPMFDQQLVFPSFDLDSLIASAIRACTVCIFFFPRRTVSMVTDAPLTVEGRSLEKKKNLLESPQSLRSVLAWVAILARIFTRETSLLFVSSPNPESTCRL